MATNKLKQYEKKYAKLEEIVIELEENTLTVDALLARYKEGIGLVKECADILNEAESDIRQLIEEVRITE